jgi:hypothetical protein
MRTAPLMSLLTGLLLSMPCAAASGDWFAFDGQRLVAGDTKHPAYKKLFERLEAGQPLVSLAFTPHDDWVALTAGTESWASDTDHPACREIDKLQKDAAGRAFRWVAFTPQGGWALLFDGPGRYRASGIPLGASHKLRDLADREIYLRAIAFAPAGGWVILFGENGVAHDGLPAAAATTLDMLVKNHVRVTNVTFTSVGDWFIVAGDGLHTNRPEHPAAKALGAAGAGSWLSFSPGDAATGYALTTTPSRRIKASLAGTFVIPRGEVEEWFVYGPKAPACGGQRDVETRLTPNGRVVEELSFLKRAMLLARVPGKGNELRTVLSIKATLLTRRLIPREAAAEVSDRVTLPRAEIERYTRSSQSLDLKARPFIDWLDRHGLRRKKDEGEVSFARRAYAHIRKHFAYDSSADVDTQPAGVCRTGKSDCGGLSSLFVAVLRASGIPARVLQGRWAQSEKAGDRVGDRPYGQWHVEAEFFARGVGWVPVDMASAILDPWRGGFAHFGNDPGDFVTFHLDQDITVPTFVAGDETYYGIQQLAHWWRGKGSEDGARFEQKWMVQSDAAR